MNLNHVLLQNCHVGLHLCHERGEGAVVMFDQGVDGLMEFFVAADDAVF